MPRGLCPGCLMVDTGQEQPRGFDAAAVSQAVQTKTKRTPSLHQPRHIEQGQARPTTVEQLKTRPELPPLPGGVGLSARQATHRARNHCLEGPPRGRSTSMSLK